LTDQLGEAAWKRFQEIENVGGYGSALSSGLLPGWVAEDRALRTDALSKGKAGWIGVNRFPSNLEASPEPAAPLPVPANTAFTPLQAWAAEASAHQVQTSKP
jgi:methylmalonyl-CoA mutase N-terminal domain/subunit